MGAGAAQTTLRLGTRVVTWIFGSVQRRRVLYATGSTTTSEELRVPAV
jgi:hypothetical protein